VWEASGKTTEFPQPLEVSGKRGAASAAARRHRERSRLLNLGGYVAEAKEFRSRLKAAADTFRSADQAALNAAKNEEEIRQRMEDAQAGSDSLSIPASAFASSSSSSSSPSSPSSSSSSSASSAASTAGAPAHPDLSHAVRAAAAVKAAQNAFDSSLKAPLDIEKLPVGSEPKVGDFLVMHPLASILHGQDQAVVLLDEFDEGYQVFRGSYVNKPSHLKVHDLLAVWKGDASGLWAGNDKELKSMADASLWTGGDVARGRGPKDDLRWLHCFDPKLVSGAREVTPGVFVGGEVSDISHQVVQRRRQSLDRSFESSSVARPTLGYLERAASQLMLELEHGVWLHARTQCPSTARAISFPAAAWVEALRVMMPETRAPDGILDETYLSSDTNRRGFMVAKDAATAVQACVWRSVLRAVGAYALADFPRGRGADPHLSRKLETHVRRISEEVRHSSKRRRPTSKSGQYR